MLCEINPFTWASIIFKRNISRFSYDYQNQIENQNNVECLELSFHNECLGTLTKINLFCSVLWDIPLFSWIVLLFTKF